MVLDWKEELAQGLDLKTQAESDLRTATDRLHLAGIHMTNASDILNAQAAQHAPELAVYLVDNRSYNTTLTKALTGYLDKIAGSQIKRVILWQNKQQLAAGFMKQAWDRGLLWDLDTVYQLRSLTTDAEFATCVQQAEALRVSAYRFDDAHNQTPEELAKVITFMRDYTDKPIIGSFGALDQRKDARGKIVPIDMPAYKDAGLTIFRQFYRQDQVDNTPTDVTKYDPTQVVSDWLASGRITDGIDLEAYKEGAVLTSASDFDSMFVRSLNAGIRDFTVYAVVNEAKFVMWTHAPALWQAVNRAAVTLRTLK